MTARITLRRNMEGRRRRSLKRALPTRVYVACSQVSGFNLCLQQKLRSVVTKKVMREYYSKFPYTHFL